MSMDAGRLKSNYPTQISKAERTTEINSGQLQKRAVSLKSACRQGQYLWLHSCQLICQYI